MTALLTWARKTTAALIVGLIGWATAITASDGGWSGITATGWIGLATVIATALGVFTIANVNPAKP